MMATPSVRGVALVMVCGLSGLALVSTLGAWGLRVGKRAPSIVLPAAPILVTAGSASEIAEATFPIKNVGGSELRFRLTPSCGCTAIEPSEGTVAPGGAVTVRFGVRLSFEGEERHPSISVASNDPASKSLTVPVSAIWPAEFQVEPASLDFGVLGIGEAKSLSFRVLQHVESGKPFDPVAEIVPPAREFAVKRGDGSGVFVATAKLMADTGSVSGRIRIAVAPGKVLEVPVRAEPFDAVTLYPRVIGANRLGPDKRPVKVFLKARAGSQVGRVIRVTAPRGITVHEIASPDMSMRLFEIDGVEARWANEAVFGKAEIAFEIEGLERPAICSLTGAL